MLDFVFDPINFCGGLALASTFFIVKNTVVAKLSGKARASVWDDFTQDVNKIRRGYSSYVDQMEAIDSSRDKVQNKFTYAFPNHSFDTSFDASLVNKTHKDLNNFLLMLNEADDFPSDTKSSVLNKHISKLKGAKTDLDWMMNCSTNSVKNFSQQVDNNIAGRNTTLENQARYQKRFKVISDAFSDMRENFVPVFLEKIPPTIFAAEKALNEYNLYVDDTRNKFMKYSDADYTYDNYPLDKAFESADKALLTVSDFKSTVMKRTAKLRVILRRTVIHTPEQQKAYDVAMESIIQAELTVYDSGNPDDTFAQITKPFLDFANDHKLIRFEERLSLNK